MGRAFEVRKVAMAKTAGVKSKLYARFGREIYMAAKAGTLDPDTNVTLKRIIEKARKEQVPNEIIKRNIDKAKGGSGEAFSLIRYEGFGPGNSQVIVECLSDNVNRTIAEVRNCFTKTGGKLGISGSVLHQFNQTAVITVADISEDEILEILVTNDIDASDIETEDNLVTIYANVTDFNLIRNAILEVKPEIDFETDEIMWLPIMYTTLDTEEEKETFERLMSMLDEIDDVQQVFHNVSI
jgi:YebC/PmpR family DNA-binding regulatory protein